MELESNPSCEGEPIHMSDTTAKVTEILSDVLGVLTTVASKERILFDIEELYLADERCDPSRPLSAYVVAGKTELRCDASFLPGNNEWNIRYKATCVWKHEKPPFFKIFGRHIPDCSAAVSLIRGRIYDGHVVQVSPPNAALAILMVNNISFPVLIFLNRLFRDSSLEELQNCEWIQDHLNTGDKVEFIFENIEKKSMHKKFHVPAFVWKSELQEQRKYADEEQRKHADEQKVRHDSCVTGVKWCRGDSQGDNTVSNVATSEGTNSDVTCVGISDVGTCTGTRGGTSVTEPPDKRHVDETKGVSTVGAAEPASNTSLLLDGEAKLKECGIYTARESGSTNLSSLKSQENDTKAEATAFSQHCDMQEASHTKHDEPVADLPDTAVQGETRHLPAMEHGICSSAAESQLDGSHFSKYTGNIYTLGYDHGTIAFTVNGKEEMASFYRNKVYVNGTRICNQSKLRDVLSLGMPVTLDVRPYTGESFTYKATAVNVELNVEEQPEVRDVASEQKDASDVVSVNSDSTQLSHKSLQNDAAIPTDQRATYDEIHFAVKCWKKYCAENTGVRKHMNDSVSGPCAYESNVTNRESCKDSTAGTIISPRKDTDITQSITTARQETAVHAHLPEEASPIFSTGVLRSEENTIVPKDDQEKVAESEADTEFKPPGIVKPSQIIGKVTSDYDTGELSTSKITLNVTCPLVLPPQSSKQITDTITVSDDDPAELFTSKTKTSTVANPVDSPPQSSKQITDTITVSDDDPAELFTSKTNTSDVASPEDSPPQSSKQITDTITVSDDDPAELFTSKTKTSTVANPVDSPPQSSKQITDTITVSDDDPAELFTSKTKTSTVANPVDSPPQSSKQITDTITVSDDDPAELFTSKTNTSDVASPEDSPPQSSKQITDTITVSDDDPAELFTSKTKTSTVASPVDSLPQSSAQITDKVTISDNDPGELFTSKTNTSNVASSVDLLPESAKNLAGVIDDVWMSNAVLMTARLKGVKLRVLIYGWNLYIKKQRCTVTNTGWQHPVQGMKVFADVLKLRDHPSGAVYLASSAWNGKKPGNGSPCTCGTEKCVNCPKKALSTDVDPSTSGSKVNSDAGKQKSKHCKTDGINYTTENIDTCREKPVLNDKSHSLQLKSGAFEEMKQEYHKALRSKKSLVDKKYVGTVERYTVDDGSGLVNFHLENVKARAVFFREHIFAKGISVTDSYVKDNITAGRLVTVSAIKPYYKEDTPYAVHIDTEFQDTKGEPATLSYSVAAAHRNEQGEVTPTVDDLECQSSKFTVKEREMFYKRRLCYDWDQGSVGDGDRRKDTEVTDHPEEARVEKQSCWGMTVDDANVTASSENKLEVRDHPNKVKLEKPLWLDKPMRDSNESSSLDNKGTEVTYHSDEVKADKPLCQEGTVGNAVVIPSTGNQQLMKLPLTFTPHTGLAKQLKEKRARVKRYESSMRGILEYSISGAVLEIVFDRSVVNLRGQSEITDMREHLPVDSIVYFDGEVVGEDSLLGCPNIVVTRVSQSKTHRKPPNSKLTHPLTFELTFPSLHEGLVTGRTYEGIVTKINPPRAFVATVTERGKTYDVFVFNTFFSPAEYGAKLPPKQSVLPYVAKGYKVHLMVDRTEEVNSKYTYEWFAVDAWTEAEDNIYRDSRHNTSKELDDHHEGVRKAHHRDHPEDGIDADHDDHLEGVIKTLYPEWGVLNADHLNDEVTFYAQETFLFGVRLTCVDLREVFKPGDKLCFTTLEPGMKKAYRAWLGAHDTPSDRDGITSRTMEIFSYCTSHKIGMSVVATLASELGKVRRQLEVSGRIRTSSLEDDDDDDTEDMWLEQESSFKASARRGAIPPDNSSSCEQVYPSDSWPHSDTDMVYVSDEEEEEESHEVSIRESSVDQLTSSETGMPFSSSSVTTVEVTSVHDAADASSSVSKLQRAEPLGHKASLKGGTANQESEHDGLPITTGATKNNEHIVPATKTSYQQCALRAQNRISEDSRTCTDGATSLSTDLCKREVSRCPVLHPEMQETLRLLLCDALQKYNIELDVSQLIVSEAVTAVEEELKGVLRGKLLDRVLNKVAESVSESEKDQRATSRVFEMLAPVSKEWKQKLSEFLLRGSVAMGQSTEQDVVDNRTQLRSSCTCTVHVQEGGRVDKAIQTVSTGSILFLQLLPDC